MTESDRQCVLFCVLSYVIQDIDKTGAVRWTSCSKFTRFSPIRRRQTVPASQHSRLLPPQLADQDSVHSQRHVGSLCMASVYALLVSTGAFSYLALLFCCYVALTGSAGLENTGGTY